MTLAMFPKSYTQTIPPNSFFRRSSLSADVRIYLANLW